MTRAKKITAKNIAKRIEGTVVGLLQHKPPSHRKERDLVRGLIVFLEDRRVLYNPERMEYGPWVQQSVQEIRQELTDILRRSPEGATLIEPVRIMRAACRKFLDALGHPDQAHRMPYHMEAVLWTALGELRGLFGQQLAILAVAYTVDLPLVFEGMLPVADEDVA